MIEYCKQAMQHIEKSDAGLAVGLLKKAKYMVNTEKIRNLPLAKSIISHSYGLLYKALGKRSTALNSFLQSIEYAKYGGNSLTLSSSHLNISLTYSQYFQYNKALSHGLLALKLCENRSGEILDIYHCIGTIYKHQNNHLCALKYFSLGSQISKKTTGKKSVHSFRLAREEKKIIKKTNLNSIIQSSPRPQSKIYEFLFNSSRHSPKRTQTPPPWSYSEDPNSIFTRLDNN